MVWAGLLGRAHWHASEARAALTAAGRDARRPRRGLQGPLSKPFEPCRLPLSPPTGKHLPTEASRAGPGAAGLAELGPAPASGRQAKKGGKDLEQLLIIGGPRTEGKPVP